MANENTQSSQSDPNAKQKSNAKKDYAYEKAKCNPVARVTRSRRKQGKLIDDLRQRLGDVLPPKANRNEVLFFARLRLAQHHGPLTNPNELRFHAAATFFDYSIKCETGKKLTLSSLWQKFVALVGEVKPEFADELLARPEHCEAFTWQAAGFADSLGKLARGDVKNVVTVRIKKGRQAPKGVMATKDGKRAFYYEMTDGSLAPMPEGERITWPIFQFPGDDWQGAPVGEYSIGNAVIDLPQNDLDWFKAALDLLLTWKEKLPLRGARTRRKSR